MALENLFTLGFFGIAALAVLWKYSDLPKIKWEVLAAGALVMVAGSAITVFGKYLLAMFETQLIGGISWLGLIVYAIGAILVVIGALQNAWKFIKE